MTKREVLNKLNMIIHILDREYKAKELHDMFVKYEKLIISEFMNETPIIEIANTLKQYDKAKKNI